MNRHSFVHRAGRAVVVYTAIAAVLAGCSSVKLDESQAPVSERSAVPVTAGSSAAGASGAAVENRTVVPVQTGSAEMAQPPANVERVIYFDFDSYVVKPEYVGTLEAHARFLNADRSRRVVLEGHTDERGGREYNLALGQKRAEAVRRALALMGVQEAQMEAVSFGKEKPAVAGSGEEVWARNRRVELTYR
ncbi:peptidoglycan-associated lipoprotein Pal [Tepidimonas charontis]|uniref:Peptidoglycan-associated lipoprotein n=1 Tax=Tepidimonas charontis TaxID=2267262 RepID=A0A554XHR9_9BURK|nr:peptidoglycan-associated lipoprotein Pal [Tepidimonas charontis]TSE35377.1 Outer membrane protein P6 [Tepidimonas charontis]